MDTIQLGYMFHYIKDAQQELCNMLGEVAEMIPEKNEDDDE